MTTLNTAELKFFELVTKLKAPITETSKADILKTLLKLNNPTFYRKHITKNPIERHGFTTSRVTNPILVSVNRMITACNSSMDLSKLAYVLQQEYAWAFHKFPDYRRVDL